MTLIANQKVPSNLSRIGGSTNGIGLFLNGRRGLSLAKRLAQVGHHISAFFVHGSAAENRDQLLRAFPGAVFSTVDGSNWEAVAQILTTVRPNVCIVAGFSHIIPVHILHIPGEGFLNLHAGPVPGYRGGSPLNWQIIQGESSIGVSVLRMTEGLDDGPVVAARSSRLPETGTIADAHRLAQSLFEDLVPNVLNDLPKALANAKPQRSADAVYWHQRSDRDGKVNVCCQTAEEVCRFVRALSHPYPGAWFTSNGDRFRVFASVDSSDSYRGTPGRIVNTGNSGLVLIVRGGSVRLLDVVCETGVRTLSNGEWVDWQ